MATDDKNQKNSAGSDEKTEKISVGSDKSGIEDKDKEDIE